MTRGAPRRTITAARHAFQLNRRAASLRRFHRLGFSPGKAALTRSRPWAPPCTRSRICT